MVSIGNWNIYIYICALARIYTKWKSKPNVLISMGFTSSSWCAVSTLDCSISCTIQETIWNRIQHTNEYEYKFANCVAFAHHFNLYIQFVFIVFCGCIWKQRIKYTVIWNKIHTQLCVRVYTLCTNNMVEGKKVANFPTTNQRRVAHR